MRVISPLDALMILLVSLTNAVERGEQSRGGTPVSPSLDGPRCGHRLKASAKAMTNHIDATGYWIAVSLVDDDGRDPAWVRMVMREKGHGNIDLDEARQWLKGNPRAMCSCAQCSPKVEKPKPQPVQLTFL